jgi:hypothetical protein
MLHFAFDKDLRFDDRHRYSRNIIWVNFEFLNQANDPDELNKQILIGLASRVYKTNKKNIRYGMNYLGSYFDEEGNLHMKSGEIGLTCATFLLAFFKGCFALDLLQYTQWPSREGDKIMQARLVAILKEEKVDQEHITRVEAENVKARFLPEEVTAASTCPFPPAAFDYCEKFGAEIKSILYL